MRWGGATTPAAPASALAEWAAGCDAAAAGSPASCARAQTGAGSVSSARQYTSLRPMICWSLPKAASISSAGLRPGATPLRGAAPASVVSEAEWQATSAATATRAAAVPCRASRVRRDHEAHPQVGLVWSTCVRSGPCARIMAGGSRSLPQEAALRPRCRGGGAPPNRPPGRSGTAGIRSGRSTWESCATPAAACGAAGSGRA